MTILSKIKEAQLQSRQIRDHAAVDLLTVLISDISMVGKNNGNRESTDSEATSILKKFMNNAEETLKVVTSEVQKTKYLAEIAILKQFLPQQLTSDSLIEAINTIIMQLNATSIKDMGKVMKVLKERYDGRYDGNVASTLVRAQLGA